MEKYKAAIKDYIYNNYKLMFREPEGIIKYPFLVPGATYKKSLWDWDSWLVNVALRQMFIKTGEEREFCRYEKGCVMNFLDHSRESGCTPALLTPNRNPLDETEDFTRNMHKPVLAQHVAFILKSVPDDIEWFKPFLGKLDKFLKSYIEYAKHENGIFFWFDDAGIGVDNEPCTFYRPPRSSGSVYLNCLMYKEFLAMQYICDLYGDTELGNYYKEQADALKETVRDICWDEKDGYYYSVDLNLYPIDPENPIHRGCPRHWDYLIQRLGSWTGFMTMWAGIATKEQAERMVAENLKDEKSFNAPYGIRTLSKYEKMYVIKPSGNPSCWLGPIWGISNYMVFKGLVKYGFIDEAKEMAEKTIRLFGEDIMRQGCMSEYYDPETGASVSKPGFQNWNLLVLNMMAWLDGEEVVEEF